MSHDHLNGIMQPALNAIDKIIKYREENRLRTSADFAHAPSPLPSPAATQKSDSPSPTMSQSTSLPLTPSPLNTTFDFRPNAANFDSARMAIPTNAYAPTYVTPSRPQSPFTPPSRSPSPFAQPVRIDSHMPILAPQTPPSPAPQLMQTPDCITYQLLFERVQDLLRKNLSSCWEVKNSELLHRISMHLRDEIIHHGVSGTFGPHGLGKLTDVFMSIGHEGTAQYSCLAVSSQWGDVTVILRGDSCELEGKHPNQDEEAMEKVKVALDEAALRLYRRISGVSGRRPGGLGLPL